MTESTTQRITAGLQTFVSDRTPVRNSPSAAQLVGLTGACRVTERAWITAMAVETSQLDVWLANPDPVQWETLERCTVRRRAALRAYEAAHDALAAVLP